METLKEGSVDLIITDPPYGINMMGKTSNTDWDNMSSEDYCIFLKDFFYSAYKVLKEGGTMWMFCARTNIPIVFSALEEFNAQIISDKEIKLELNLENWLTYARQKGRGANTKLKSQAEEVLHFSKGKKYYYSSIEYLREVVVPYVKDGKPRGWFLDQTDGIRKRWSGVGNVLCFTSPFFKNKFEPQIHSTQKPILLWCELIALSSKPDDIVFDPFAGSGSSGVASDMMNRNYIGCELDKDMFDKAIEWVNNYDKDLVKEYIGNRIRHKETKSGKISLW